MRVALVLRSGGEYRPEHAQKLASKIRQHLSGAEVVVLSDVDVPGVERIPLKHPEYRGWFSKIELMRPDIAGDLLYLDLDTDVLRNLAQIAAVGRLTMLRDFYKLQKLQSGLMFLPEADRKEAWACRDRLSSFRGDGEYLHSIWNGKAKTWQDVLPGQVVSYKCHVMRDPRKQNVHVGDGTVPRDARIVCFHGQPRPWGVPPLKVASSGIDRDANQDWLAI